MMTSTEDHGIKTNIILHTESCVKKWRERMALLSNADYDDGELGMLIIESLNSQDLLARRIPEFIEHFAAGHYEEDHVIAFSASRELIEEIRVLFETVIPRDSSGEAHAVFLDWIEDDLLIEKQL